MVKAYILHIFAFLTRFLLSLLIEEYIPSFLLIFEYHNAFIISRIGYSFVFFLNYNHEKFYLDNLLLWCTFNYYFI